MRLIKPFTATVAALVAWTMTGLAPQIAEAAVPHVLTSGAVGSSRQVVLVSAAASSSTSAQLSWWIRHADGSWHLNRNPVAVRVGARGLTTNKREGDGRTPMGVFPAGLAFGTGPNPGTKLAWRTSNGNSRWVDDVHSRYYNLWMQAPSSGRWASAERLHVTAYAYALDVGYNRARTPGKGSAIFLHLATGRATSGCITADRTTVVGTLRWLNPTLHPVVVIGTRDWIASH